MGAVVLDPGPSERGLHLYAHCLNHLPGGVTLLAINLSRTDPKAIVLSVPAERYTLTAAKLEDTEVELNGQQLKMLGDEMPVINGERIASGLISLPPASISFFAIADAKSEHCL